MASGIKIAGFAKMRQNLTTFARQYPEVIGQAMVDELTETEKPESQDRCPKKSGTAAGTAEVIGPHITKRAVSAAVTFARDPGVVNPEGKRVQDYIVPLHEDLEAIHENGQAKFLESVWNEAKGHFGARVAKRAGFENVKL